MKWFQKDGSEYLYQFCVLRTSAFEALCLIWSVGKMYSGNQSATLTIDINHETAYVDVRLMWVGMIRFVLFDRACMLKGTTP